MWKKIFDFYVGTDARLKILINKKLGKEQVFF